MHPYQIDEEIKTRVFLISAFLSVGLAWIFSLVLQISPYKIPWWIETPSVLGFFGLFTWLFDNYLWKTALFQKLEWLYIPNINGKWKAEIKSSFTGFEQPITANVFVRQTASRISITLETQTSSSNSVHAALIRVERLNKFELTYNYINKPKADSLATMSIHHGTVWLEISDDLQKLDGEYFSGRGRQNFGRLILVRANS